MFHFIPVGPVLADMLTPLHPLIPMNIGTVLGVVLLCVNSLVTLYGA